MKPLCLGLLVLFRGHDKIVESVGKYPTRITVHRYGSYHVVHYTLPSDIETGVVTCLVVSLGVMLSSPGMSSMIQGYAAIASR